MKKRILILVFLMGFFNLAQSAIADSPAPNLPYRIESSNGQCYVEMVPEDGWGGYGAGRGTAYQVGSNAAAQELWSVDIYASQAVLTNNGRHLIALGPLASSLSDLAISFYQDGKEIKRYSIQELIHDESKLEHTASHFFWRRDHNEYAAGLSGDEKEYALQLIDGSVYVFDVTSGQILRKEQPPAG